MTRESTSVGEGKEVPQLVRDNAEAVSKEGFVDSGDGVGAVRALVPEAKSTRARIRKLIEKGVTEEEAKERAVAETVGEIEGKEKNYPDMAAYVREQREKMDEYKIVMDESVPEVARSGWFKNAGDYFRIAEPLREGEVAGVAYLSKDNTIRFLCYPPDNCMIDGVISCGKLSTYNLALCGFKEANVDRAANMIARDWLCQRLKEYVHRKDSEEKQKRTQEFEF